MLKDEFPDDADDWGYYHARAKVMGNREIISYTITEKYVWYTPMIYIDAARKVMGDIAVDPATDEDGQKRIQAKSYFTAETNGLTHPWQGTVWLAAPYQEPLISQFMDKAFEEYEIGNAYQEIILTNTSTTWKPWFQKMISKSNAMCFVNGRIQWVPGHSSGGFPPYSEHGSVFFYLGESVQTFCDVFKEFGWTIKN